MMVRSSDRGQDPELHLGVLCLIAHRAAETRVMERLHAAGYDDLTVTQARVFARLGPEGTRVGDLAEQAQVTKQTATALVDQLERRAYVERVADPADQRARLVRFAPRGTEACAVARRAEEEVREEWEAHLGPRAAAQLRSALEKLREITDPWA
ncbi:MarR family winged helix-turn-helix transcriptional regulator [Nocardioides scoriae]|nr:MarR family transcriptional regulator [Nocardioides scoriae]